MVQALGFRPGDIVMHPRWGRGRVLNGNGNGTITVRFDVRAHPDVLYPALLVQLDSEGIAHFVLTCYCPVCTRAVDADLRVLGQAQARFGSVSLLCLSPEVGISWSQLGTPIFIHRTCGEALVPETARPIVRH